MSEQTDDPGGFQAPPESFLTYRPDTVIALMDDAGEVSKAIEELGAAGYPRDQIFVLSGPEGAEHLDASGSHHGVRGRVHRAVEYYGEEREMLEDYGRHLAAGGFGVEVPATENEYEAAARILKSHGAHEIIHLGRLGITPLS